MKQKAVIEILSNVRARLSGAPQDVLRYLDKQLAEVQKGSEWSPQHRRFGGRWDGKKHHFHISPTFSGVGTFPKGLLSRVRTLLAKKGVKAKTVDRRAHVYPPVDQSCVHAEMLHGVNMTGEYAFQLDAVKAALTAEAGILFMATNAGKSTIAAALIRALSDKQILYVVPKKILLSQARKDLAAFLGTIPEAIGTIGQGKFDPKEITIAIINSVTPVKARSARAKKRNAILKKYLLSVDAVFLDEGHHAKAATWFRFMNALTNAQYRYLMSGTPFTGDNDLMIEAASGPVIYEIRNDALIKLGVSAKPTVRLYTIDKPDLAKHPLDDESFKGVYDAAIVYNAYRNQIIARIAANYARQGKSVVVLVRILAQGAAIREFLVKEKVPVEFAHGKMPDDERDRITDWYKAKPGRVLVGSNIYDEGVNIPQMNALVIGDGQKSLRAILQKVGRSIRKKKGANVVDVVDFADVTHYFMSKHSLDRLDIYEGEGFDVVEEETPKKEKQDAVGRKRTDANGTQAVQALPCKAHLRDDVDGHRQLQLRAVGGAAEEGHHVVSEGCVVVLWRWRQAA